MRRNKVLLVLDETLAGDELDRVSRFLNDIAAVSPIQSISGLIRHVEQIVPPVSVPMLHGDSMLPSGTGMPQIIMRYTPCDEHREGADGEALTSQQLRQRMSEILEQCTQPAVRYPRHRLLAFLPSDLAAIELQYDSVVCVRPVCGDGALMTRGDQLVCQLAESSQQPLWRCPPRYEGIGRVVVAWPDAETGKALLSAAANLAEVWNVPFCVLSAGGQRHQQAVQTDVQTAREQAALPMCDVLTCDRLEEIAKCVNSNDLLVMGAYGRWWPWRLFSASHTETILQNLNCPALLLPSQTEGVSGSADASLWFASPQPRIERADVCAQR